MSYNATNEVCTIDGINAEELQKFVIDRIVIKVNVQGLCSCAYSCGASVVFVSTQSFVC